MTITVLLAFLSLISCVLASNSTTDERISRSLLGIKPPTLTVDAIVKQALSSPPKIPLLFQPWSKAHVPSDQAIFSCALSTTYIGKDAIFFAGTARKAGFTGDIVVAVLPNSNQNFLNKLKDYNVSVYVVPIECAGRSDVRCKFRGVPDFPVTLARYFIYQAWAVKYATSAYIMISDFRDVLFQSNPFKNKIADWGPSNFDLVVFQEAHPNRVINRCPHTGGFLLGCYGKDVYRKIGTSTISSSGVVFGTRDAIIVYTHLIVDQGVEPKSRALGSPDPQAIVETLTNKKCWGLGFDQAVHNYLLYTGLLTQLMNVKVFPQGEGPVNTLGGFFGDAKILRASLAEWKIIRGEEAFKYVYNWNGEISSVVHQLDRYLYSELEGGYAKHLAVMQHMT